MDKKEKKELMTFVETFFKNIGAEVRHEEDMVCVSKVPADLEDIFGKKQPYKFRFEKEGDESSEFITKGSTVLKSMMGYLEQKGKTTLIKIPFDRDYKKEIEHYLTLKNSIISSFVIKKEYGCIVKFGIATTLQYLNEKEQITNSICVREGKVIDFSLEKYGHIEGKKEELVFSDFKKEYDLAKKELSNLIKKRVEENVNMLSNKLDKEIDRIKKHYLKQKSEFEEMISKYEKQKSNLEEQKKKSKSGEEDQIINKIKKVEEAISQMKNSDALDKMKKEEEFFINDEKNKHSLRISSKLINTSIIYYPIFNFEIFLKSDGSLKRVELIYDPYEDRILKEISCQSCNRQIREIFLCSTGHIACASCAQKCAVCNSALCLSCSKKWCELCGKKLCKKCLSRCNSCMKDICKLHTNKDYTDQKDYCSNCVKMCELCSKFANKNKIRRLNNKDMCDGCYRFSSINYK